MHSIFTRRSVRQFIDKEIEDDKKLLLLKAGMQAPSAMNQQAWEFIVIEGREKLDVLSTYNPHASCLKTATLAIILVGNTERFRVPMYWEQDLGAATQNILLEAVELGLGAVWLGAQGREERVDILKQMYSLPDNIKPFAVIAIGYPAAENANHYDDRYDESRVTYL